MNLESLTQHLKLPDLWQHEAVNHLRAGKDVIVVAPTGAGKTFVFELFFKTAKLKAQAVYTVPTRALANDKHAEWREAGWNVGLATGDISENVHAPVLVATLETQLERLIINDGPALLVMDEFQMIADPARGAHYEAAIILAPKNTQLLLLSGSVENPQEVAEWMRRLGRSVEVVATNDRPVPLEETPIEGLPQRGKGLEAWWPRMVTAVLMADLAPLLIFAPRRKDAESIARKLATALPQGEPLSLTNEQRALAGKEFSTLLERRIAYHHSGLSYALRAGLVEPLAKSGQLRVIVSTLGLAAGINFSVRSVHVASTTFHDGLTEQTLSADDLLQMFGRAGRRGLDERGYVITSRDSPTLADARAAKLRRSSRLSWPIFLRVMRHAAITGGNAFAAARDFAQKLFAKAPPELGLEEAQPIATGKATAVALFGLKATRRELHNSEGTWEEMRHTEPKKVPLREAWLVKEEYRGPALASVKWVQKLSDGQGRVMKLAGQAASGFHLYGKEMALGSELGPEDAGAIRPTHALRKMLRIPNDVETLSPEKIEKVALPRLSKFFEGARLLGTAAKEKLLWAQFDYSEQEVECFSDTHGRWIMSPEIRVVERATETGIQEEGATLGRAARPGTPVHAWRELGLIEADGAPTRRGVIFSFFQHGEGLAIAAALEDESYPVDELVLHLANLRSDCRLEMPGPGGSERLAAVCRATYGFVNHHGYLEAGLPLGYGEGTAELLGLVEQPELRSTQPGTETASGQVRRYNRVYEVAEGDLSRAYIEWLSLLRHMIHAPAYDWSRWVELKNAAAVLLANHLVSAHSTLHPKLPPLTPKQRHDRPKHWIKSYGR